jgi:hypothetical protein
MATVAADTAESADRWVSERRIPGRQPAERWFYFAVAVGIASIAVAGFFPSYLSKVAGGTSDLPLIYHVHATLFFAWCALNVTQTWLVARGRIYAHREWGLLGIALGTAMAISVVLMVISSIKFADAHGHGLAARHFSYLNIAGAVKFLAFFGFAIAFAHRREVHKRLMVLANASLLGAPMGRLVMLTLIPPALRHAPPPGYAIILILLLGYSPVFAGIIFDWRTRGRPHPVYLIGLVFGLGTGLLTPVIGNTPGWMTVIGHIVDSLG